MADLPGNTLQAMEQLEALLSNLATMASNLRTQMVKEGYTEEVAVQTSTDWLLQTWQQMMAKSMAGGTPT